LKIPYVDIHTHRLTAAEDIVAVRVMGRDEFELSRIENLNVAGIHPWWLEDLSKEELLGCLNQITQLAHSHKLWGIGETGLDRTVPETLVQQKEYLFHHIHLSESLDLPLIIHNVRAGADFLQVLKKSRPQQPWIFHDFRGHESLVHDFIRLHPRVHFSFGLSLDNSQHIRDLLPKLPLDRIFFETDDQKHLDIKEIYLRASHFLKLDLEVLKEKIWTNFLSLKRSPLVNELLS
jgi:TatD DNase family protein